MSLQGDLLGHVGVPVSIHARQARATGERLAMQNIGRKMRLYLEKLHERGPQTDQDMFELLVGRVAVPSSIQSIRHACIELGFVQATNKVRVRLQGGAQSERTRWGLTPSGMAALDREILKAS